MMLATTPEQMNYKKPQKPTKNGSRASSRASSVAPSKNSLEAASINTTLNQRRTTASSSAKSTHTVNSMKSSGAKMVYDPCTLRYVKVGEVMTHFQQKDNEFQDLVARFKKSDRFPANNESLNSAMFPAGTHSPRFTLNDIEQLRYCYFQEFEPDAGVVQAKLQTSTPKYAVSVANNAQLVSKEVRQYYNKLKTKNNARKHYVVAMDYQDFRDGMVLNKSRIRAVLHQDSFWTDVFQDIKYELGTANYFEWLPTKPVVQKFVLDLVDHVLYDLHCFTCKISGFDLHTLNADEVHELNKRHYFFFGAYGVAGLTVLKRALTDNFVDRMHLHSDAGTDDIRMLLKVLIGSVCDNLKIHYYGRGEAVLLLLGEFLSAMGDVLWEARLMTSRERFASLSSEESQTSSVFEAEMVSLASDGLEPGDCDDVPAQAADNKKKRGFLRRMLK